MLDPLANQRRTRSTRGRIANAAAALAQLGPRLAHLRSIRGLGIRQVEKRVGVDKSTVSQVESGKRGDYRLSTILALAVAYEVDVVLRRDGRIVIRGRNLETEGAL